MTKRIAILIDSKEDHPPSNDKALELFGEAAVRCGLKPVFIERDGVEWKLHTVERCDAIFVRTITDRAKWWPYGIIEHAEEGGIPVIDASADIRNGSDKIYTMQAERFGIKTPRSKACYSYDDFNGIDYPFVVKPSYGWFCKGAFLVKSSADMRDDVVFPVVAQEFMYTPFDWRIGVIDHEVFYASKYYMAKDHWQITDYNQPLVDGQGLGYDTAHRVEDVPDFVKEAALSAVRNMYGDGFYGIDIKEKDGEAYLLEVNDNPSIDSGIEDKIYGDAIYDRVMQWFVKRLESR